MEHKNFIENSKNVQNKNPLSNTDNATEGNIRDNKLSNCCNNIISISTQKVNKYNFNDIKEKAKRVSVKSFLQKAKHGNYICPFCVVVHIKKPVELLKYTMTQTLGTATNAVKTVMSSPYI